MSYHPVVTQILELLNQHNCWHQTFEHQPVRTSHEAAQVRTGYTLEQGAKALIIKTKAASQPATFQMLVLPGDARFNSKKIKSQLQIKSSRFATPAEVDQLTGGVQPGGVPPFGNLFDLPVIVDPSVLAFDKIIFNAGDRRFSIACTTKDYQRLVQPKIAQII